VTADIIAREIVVYGNVKGNLRAKDRIEIKKDGSSTVTDYFPHHDRRRAYFKAHRDRQESRKGIRRECICPELFASAAATKTI